MNIKIKNQNGEWVEAAYTLNGDNLLVEPKVFIPQNGDVVAIGESEVQIMICKTYTGEDVIDAHIFFNTHSGKIRVKDIDYMFFSRRATEKEKKLLFDKMEEEGYEWDDEKKEVRKKRWKPNLNERYYYPRCWGCDILFSPNTSTWHGYPIDERIFNAGWGFKTVEECQDMCNKINKEIRKLQLCESNDTK